MIACNQVIWKSLDPEFQLELEQQLEQQQQEEKVKTLHFHDVVPVMPEENRIRMMIGLLKGSVRRQRCAVAVAVAVVVVVAV